MNFSKFLCGLGLTVAVLPVSAQELTIPEMMKPMYGKIVQGVSQWGETEWSTAVAQEMMTKSGPAVDDSLRLSRIEEVTPGVWMIYAPIVNVVVIDTDEGLVLIDAGHAAAGPAILKLLRSVSDKPIHTVVYTHGHTDHAFGAWALLEAGEQPQIIATKQASERMQRYVTMRGHFGKYLPQAVEIMPKTLDDIDLPTVTFEKEYRFTVGGEDIILRQHRGETDGHLYAWLPKRKLIAVGDFWQGFLSNAGNGRRQQRHIEDWTRALQEMHDLDVEWMLPAHGKPAIGSASIRSELMAVINAYQYVIDYTLDALNKGIQPYLIVEQFTWPEKFANDDRLQPRYNTAQDMVKVLVREYTGWWNGLPADWSPATMQSQAKAIVSLAGGIDAMLDKARAFIASDPAMGLHMAQWAWLAEPDNADVKAVYAQALYRKGMTENVTGMEASVYIQTLRQLMAQ